MKKLCLLFGAFICFCSANVFAQSPCDSEISNGRSPASECEVRTNEVARTTATSTKKFQDSEISNGQRSVSECTKNKCKKPVTNCQKPCEVTQREISCSENFLCTCKNMEKLFNCIGLSETQKCAATKIQEKYNLEVLSLNERIQCEEDKLCSLKKGCSSKRDICKQKRLIKQLKKERQKICKCYEKQFKSLMSDMQIKKYKKAIKK